VAKKRHLLRAVVLAAAIPFVSGPLPARAARPPAPRVIDAFDDPAPWSAFPADGVELKLSGDAGDRGRALRLDFRFTGGGYAIARRQLSLDLPDNYVFTFRLRGEAPVEHLEFKLIDATGENVWWHVERDTAFPREWRTFTIRKRQISYAWGPAGGGELRHAAALEFAITAGSGGAGTVWLDQLELRELPPEGTPPPAPIASASSTRKGQPPAAVLDNDPATAWASAAHDSAPWLALDLGAPREFGGLVLDWAPGRHAVDYDVEASDGGRAWRPLQQVRGANGARDWLFLPESEARRLRLRILASADQAGPVLAGLTIEPLAWSASREAFFGAIAQAAPRGLYPRGIRGEQPFWTIVGLDDDTREGLLGEDGALETGPGRFSVEPFLFVDGRLLTWADVVVSQSLEGADLPIPSVTWRSGPLRLTATVFAVGEPGASSLVARYRVANTGPTPATPTLFLALRPFQVNPPAQFLNLRGGCAPLRAVALEPAAARVDGDTALVCLTPPAASGATTFAGGDIVADYLRAGLLPPAAGVNDEFGAASAAFAWPFALLPGEEAETALVIPLHPASLAALAGRLPPPGAEAATRTWIADALRRCGNAWRQETGAVRIELPPSAAPLEASIRAQLGWILVARAGPAFQPGVRSYARSWIRDGALTASALQRLGLPGPSREFAEWYAPHQYPSGKIPCVVDARGADPVPEHDSSGEFIFMIAEDYRYTGDRDFAARLWPRVRAAAAYLDSLRHERLGEAWRAPDKVEFHGLLPPSISHEGYSARPMHSYWDDFFALRGFRDAAYLAGALGYGAERARWDAVAAEFARDLAASVAAGMKRHDVDYVPGCADLGDFDATSTAIAFDPTAAAALLPPAAVLATFERYWQFFRDRRAGAPWDAYTPYELRVIGAFVRLGWRERAGELLGWFLADQKPSGWRQWPEVVTRDQRVPRFLGDLPHTWVGADFLRSALDLFAYTDEAAQTLVIGAGVQQSWIDEDPGVAVRGLRTPPGPLTYTMRRENGQIVVQVEDGLTVPTGGILVKGPWAGTTGAMRLNGQPVQPRGDGSLLLRVLPARLEIDAPGR
jgi:hypothetical protein